MTLDLPGRVRRWQRKWRRQRRCRDDDFHFVTYTIMPCFGHIRPDTIVLPGCFPTFSILRAVE